MHCHQIYSVITPSMEYKIKNGYLFLRATLIFYVIASFVCGQDVSPRLSADFSTSTITIRSNNDPYGVFSISVVSTGPDGKFPEPGRVELLVTRTGGVLGQVTLQLRTVGGGEPWDRFIDQSLGGLVADTIGEALGGRDEGMQAIAARDYQRLEETLDFQPGDTEKTVPLYIIDDVQSEGDEVIFVYIDIVTEGARVARPSTDNGLKGYEQILVRRNDFWNGWLGFYLANSSRVTVDEDVDPTVHLTIERRNASFGQVEIFWRAIAEPNTESARSNRIDLLQQLVTTTGVVECAAMATMCDFSIRLRDDQTPENGTWFLVELYLMSEDAQEAVIDRDRRYANVTILPSDYPNGVVRFSQPSRNVYINQDTRTLSLVVERRGFDRKSVSVGYETREIGAPIEVSGVRIYPAIQGSDYIRASGSLTFNPGQTEQLLTISLDPLEASVNPYPKTFNVVLKDTTSGAQLEEEVASVTITVQADVAVWQLWPQARTALDNDTIANLVGEMQTVVRGTEITTSQLSVLKGMLDSVLAVAETKPLQSGVRRSIMGLFCQLLEPDRADATRGHWQLSQYMERFVYSHVTSLQCDTCCQRTFIQSTDCPYVSFEVAKRYPEEINEYRWTAENKDYFVMPRDLLRVQDHGQLSNNPKCYPIAFIDYKNDQWFVRGDSSILLNHKVLSASVIDENSRALSQPVQFRIHSSGAGVPVRGPQCTYFDEEILQWTTGLSPSRPVCSVRNNLALALDDFVDCSCLHLSLYAVRSEVRDQDKIGYPIWFHISCFICIAALALTILAHHVCNLQTMFSSNLLMHMCFAILATEVCYVIDAYSSPYHILNDDNNNRCIVMGLFLHYFFLAQFTWMMTQAINLFKVLVLNDEHTDRKYVTYFLIGWGLPLLIIAAFYITTYLIYRYLTDLPVSTIYGDLLGTKDICFVTNIVAGLAGVVAPCLIFLMIVGVVFIQAFQITAQWQSYDDIYRGRYNIHEVRYLLLLYGLMVLLWLWGGLHMAYGQLWMLALFCIFNIITGIYVFVLYTLLRNSCMPCLKPQKSVFSINASIADLSEDRALARDHVDSSVKSYRHDQMSTTPEQPWQKEVITAPSNTNSMLRVKRQTPPQHDIYVIPPTPYGTRPPSVADQTSEDLDDLILALKTGAVTTDSSHLEYPSTDSSLPSTRLERKHISIADTHL